MSALRAYPQQPEPVAPVAAEVPGEVPGLAYYIPAPANRPAPPSHPLTALEQMYGYWSPE
ncbi:MAG: hypothetical protein HZT43_06280 [Exiguobacterium profundum]|nr:MAG: hypothetical protein HZT43_06280 [Exiguobacterium profundum]